MYNIFAWRDSGKYIHSGDILGKKGLDIFKFFVVPFPS